MAEWFRLPSQLNITDGNVSENYKKWKRQMQVYLTASGASGKAPKVQTAIILNCAGPHILEVYDQFTWQSDGDEDKPDKVFEQLEQFCNPRQNEVLQSYRFWNVPFQEPFDSFLTELRTKAEPCNFAEKDRMIRDKIVFTVSGKLQELLLREEALDLNKTTKICRAYEQSNTHVQEIRNTSSREIHKVNQKKPEPQMLTQRKMPTNKNRLFTPKECAFCGFKHQFVKSKCPAWGKICDACQGRNHFKSKCLKVHLVETEDVASSPPNDDDDFWLAAIHSGPKDTVSALMKVNNCEIKFQLDSASDVNTICQKFVRQEQVRKTTYKLRMWNKSVLEPLGEVDLEMTNPQTGEVNLVTFVVVPNSFTCLLGLKTILTCRLITINEERFIAKVEISQKLGDLGEATLKVDPDIPPKILPSRKIPIAIQDDVKRELDMLVTRGVLVPVTEPTQWVSQMAVVHKQNGDLRICIDPQPLNTALMREHCKLPTLDDILPKLHNARIFSKLDIKEAYWHVKLDEKSSLLTTMITPFGRYRWSRLPFGLKVSSEIFQRTLSNAIGDLKGVFTIADDIIIVGCGEDDKTAKYDNTEKLRDLQKRCEEQNIVLNNQKSEICLSEIKFHGHKISKEGIKVDEAKVVAILDMPVPTDVSGVKRLCGVVQYMAKFLPDLADTMQPIYALTRKDVPWEWSNECDRSFESIKRKLTMAPVLSYFDPGKEVVIQVDSSKNGIGAVLLQNGKPVEYASRALRPPERNWAQIEKEALSCLYGLEHFDQYTYGGK